MGENSAISWTHHTQNFWRGCTHAMIPDGAGELGNEHPGCAHCYAQEMAKRNPKLLGVWGPEDEGGKRVVAPPSYWEQLHKWNDAAKAAGEYHRVFTMSLSDMFEEWPGMLRDHRGNRLQYSRDKGLHDGMLIGDVRNATLDDVRREIFDLTEQFTWLRFLCLTKRPQNVRAMLQRVGRDKLPDNYWLGTSISNQYTANMLVPKLMDCADLVPLLFLSVEPLISDVVLDYLDDGTNGWIDCLGGVWGHNGEEIPDGTTGDRIIGWVIVGGESGHHRRDCGLSAIEKVVAQCKRGCVPCFVKQDCDLFPGKQGRIPDHVWNVKQFPEVHIAN